MNSGFSQITFSFIRSKASCYSVVVCAILALASIPLVSKSSSRPSAPHSKRKSTRTQLQENSEIVAKHLKPDTPLNTNQNKRVGRVTVKNQVLGKQSAIAKKVQKPNQKEPKASANHVITPPLSDQNDMRTQLKNELIHSAFKLAQNSEHPSEDYAEIAKYFIAIGQSDRALEFFRKAEQSASDPDDHQQTSQNLLGVLKNYLRSHLPNRAESLVEQITHPATKDKALVELSHYAANRKNYNDAVYFKNHISNEQTKGHATSRIALAHIAHNNQKKALQTISSIPNEVLRDRTLNIVAKKIAQAGDFDSAERVTKQIKTKSVQEQSWNQLLEIVANRGLVENRDGIIAIANDRLLRDHYLTSTVSKAVEKKKLHEEIRANKGQITSGSLQSSVELQALYLGRAGRINAAKQKALSLPSGLKRDRAFATLSVIAGKKHTIARGRKMTEFIENRTIKDKALANVTTVAAEKGESHEVQKTITSIKTPDHKALAITSVANELVKDGNSVKAKNALSEIDRLIPKIQSKKIGSTVLSLQSKTLVQLGKNTEAYEKAQEISDHNMRDKTFRSLALHFAKHDKIKQAEQSTNSIKKEALRNDTEAKVAKTLAGNSRLTEAKATARKFKKRHQKIQYLLSVAQQS